MDRAIFVPRGLAPVGPPTVLAAFFRPSVPGRLSSPRVNYRSVLQFYEYLRFSVGLECLSFSVELANRSDGRVARADAFEAMYV